MRFNGPRRNLFGCVARCASSAVLFLSLGTLPAPVLAHAPALPSDLSVGVLADGGQLEGLRNGRVTGFGGELLELLLARSAIRLEPRAFNSREELLDAACQGKVDLVVNALPRRQYSSCLLYSASYLERSTVLVARRNDARTKDPDFIESASLVVEDGSALAGELQASHPDVRVSEAETVRKALEMVASGRVDAFVGALPLVRPLLESAQFQELESVQLIGFNGGAYRFAGGLHTAAVIRELNRELAALPASALESLRQRWLGTGVIAFSVSDAERAVLRHQGAVRYSIPAPLPPFAFRQPNGEWAGLTIDYLNLLSRMLDLRLVQEPSRGLEEDYTRAAKGELDLVVGVSGHYDLPPNVTWVGSYETAPLVIVAPTRSAYAASLDALRGARVAVARDDAARRGIERQLGAATIVPANTVLEGLDIVASGDADAIIGNLPTMDALIRNGQLEGVRIGGEIGVEQSFDLVAGAHVQALVPVFKRALATIPEVERLRIRNRWLTATYEFETPWRLIVARIWPFLLAGALGMLAIVVAFVSMRSQVKQRQRTQARLQRELALKEALLASLPGPVAAKDARMQYVDLNPAFEAFFGRKREQLIGCGIEAVHLQPSAAHDAIIALQQRVRLTMLAQSERIQIMNAAGQLRSAKYWAIPYRDSDGSLGGIVTNLIDVTDIHQAQERALMFERRLKDITDSLPAIVYQMRRHRDKLKRVEVTYAAGAGVSSIDITAEMLLANSAPLHSHLHRDDVPRVWRALLRAEKTHRAVEVECRLVGNNSGRWIFIRMVAGKDGETTVWNGVMTDWSERRQQAQALHEAKEAAEASLRAKESFLAMMSHEIRTPMNGVLGLVELMQKTSLSHEQQHMLKLARDSGSALARILDDVLDYAKIEAGRLAILPAPLDLRELFDSVLSLLLPQAQEKNLRMHQHVDAAVPATVQADGIRLRQILFNLLGNAIKFTDRGSVALAACVEGQEDASATTIAILVNDTGIGIPKADMGRLFAPFVQSERESIRHFEGTGLGLAISKRLAGMMGGELTLSSEENVGTTATFRFRSAVVCARYDLPALKQRLIAVNVEDPLVARSLRAYADAAGMRPASGRATPDTVWVTDAGQTDVPEDVCAIVDVDGHNENIRGPRLGKTYRLEANPLRWSSFLTCMHRALAVDLEMAGNGASEKIEPGRTRSYRVLVVEDQPINREVAKRQLRMLGHESVVCENGEQALKLLKSDRYDLVLTDCHMPVIDGFELTRLMRSSDDRNMRKLPVIGITATTVREEHLRCFEVGMNAIVLKPTTLAAVQAALEKVFDPAEAEGCAGIAANECPPEFADGQPSSFKSGDIDREAMKRAFEGMLDSEEVLLACQQTLTQDRDALLHCLEKHSFDELAPWWHRASGALSLLGQRRVDQMMDAFRDTLKQGNQAEIRAAARAVLSMLAVLLDWTDEAIESNGFSGNARHSHDHSAARAAVNRTNDGG